MADPMTIVHPRVGRILYGIDAPNYLARQYRNQWDGVDIHVGGRGIIRLAVEEDALHVHHLDENEVLVWSMHFGPGTPDTVVIAATNRAADVVLQGNG